MFTQGRECLRVWAVLTAVWDKRTLGPTALWIRFMFHTCNGCAGFTRSVCDLCPLGARKRNGEKWMDGAEGSFVGKEAAQNRSWDRFTREESVPSYWWWEMLKLKANIFTNKQANIGNTCTVIRRWLRLKASLVAQRVKHLPAMQET